MAGLAYGCGCRNAGRGNIGSRRQGQGGHSAGERDRRWRSHIAGQFGQKHVASGTLLKAACSQINRYDRFIYGYGGGNSHKPDLGLRSRFHRDMDSAAVQPCIGMKNIRFHTRRGDFLSVCKLHLNGEVQRAADPHQSLGAPQRGCRAANCKANEANPCKYFFVHQHSFFCWRDSRTAWKGAGSW
ncbi:MAG: hypothetical protein A3F78_10045 [Burkholderiales bacterium RIFCSPLOWO2_12_FULL_61_40]|nr:MAG: hypothetical protein A3F78_10045 [Burkholderiales bacterium RIFCSPLOWO2_12_FULL_61_40]